MHQGLSLNQIKQNFLEGESSTLSPLNSVNIRNEIWRQSLNVAKLLKRIVASLLLNPISIKLQFSNYLNLLNQISLLGVLQEFSNRFKSTIF